MSRLPRKLRSLMVLAIIGVIAVAIPSYGYSAAEISSVRVGTFEDHTRIVLVSDSPIAPRLFTLGSPNRLVIDLPEIRWGLRAEQGKVESRLVNKYRVGLFRPDVARLVLNLTRSVRIEQIDQRESEKKGQFEYEIRLSEIAPKTRIGQIGWHQKKKPTPVPAVAVTPAESSRLPSARLVEPQEREHLSRRGFDPKRANFGALDKVISGLSRPTDSGSKPAPVQPLLNAVPNLVPPERAALAKETEKSAPEPAIVAAVALKRVERPKTLATPKAPPVKPITIALDPGHGGRDPGTGMHHTGVNEKSVNLAFARTLKALLDDDPDFRVIMTRNKDVFVKLEERVTIAKDAGADLLISIHADWFSDPTIKGATAYTLSEAASLRNAEEIVSELDASETVAGIQRTGTRDDVMRVLLDLARRETQTKSSSFAQVVVEELEEVTPVVRGVKRHDLHVLRTADLPAVLIELGYMSNEGDRELLQSEAWRAKTAKAVHKALKRWRHERFSTEVAAREDR